MHTIEINTAKPYHIYVGEGLLEQTYPLIKDTCHFKNVVIVTDDNVAPLYLETVAKSFPAEIAVSSYVIPNGEQSKNAGNMVRLVDFFAEKKLTRTDLIIALGGGVVGDLTGFAASVYLRGIPYIQIPTTLLAQVDSSVGGKTAVNIAAGKNLMGNFYQPAAVLCDTGTLKTLRHETFSDGVGEVIKYGCIYDEALFEQTADIYDPDTLREIIIRCIRIKAQVVAEDEFDKGLRMILNFGHTIGHAIEKHYHYAYYTHGQGVAIGMVHITALSEQAGLTEPGTARRVLGLVQKLGLPCRCDLTPDSIVSHCGLDKKNLEGAIHLIVLKRIGSCFIHKMSKQEFSDFVRQPVATVKTNRRLEPGTLSGTVTVPASKSILHRALICAALAKGTSKIHHAYLSDDVLATIDCLTALGAEIEISGDTIQVRGISDMPVACATPSALDCATPSALDCGESGSTLRFLIPLAAALGASASFTGKGRLVSRPLNIYEQLLPEHGAAVRYHEKKLPFEINGQLKPGGYTLKGNVSSQFITGLLFALPLLDGNSTITVLPPYESRSYVDITLSVLRRFGVTVKAEYVPNGDTTYRIHGGQSYAPCDYTAESDYSQSAFFLVANALGSDITLKNFAPDSVQGDRAILDILKQSGTETTFDGTAISTVTKARRAFHVSAADIPDLVPILCLLASQCDGDSTITHTERLKIKESDRIASTRALLESLGGTLHYADGTITIPGNQTLRGGTVDSHNDHRIAMCAAVAATIASGDVIIKDSDSVRKSYPSFYRDHQSLGGAAHVFHVE